MAQRKKQPARVARKRAAPRKRAPAKKKRTRTTARGAKKASTAKKTTRRKKVTSTKKRTARRAAKKAPTKKSSRSTTKKKSTKRSTGKRAARPRTTTQYQVDPSFVFFGELQRIILKTLPEVHPKLERSLKRVGNIKLAVVTGSFLENDSARIDLLVVGDTIPVQKLTKAIKNTEVDLGKEIRYVMLSVSEFSYRSEMHDRFLQDIFEEPHYELINRLKKR